MKLSSVCVFTGTFGLIVAASADTYNLDDILVVTGFSVEISGAGSGTDTDSAWESVTGGALNIETADNPNDGDQVQSTTLGQKYVDTLTLRGPITGKRKTPGSKRCGVGPKRDQVNPRKRRGDGVNFQAAIERGSYFQTLIEGLPDASTNVESIIIEDMAIDIREDPSVANWDYRVYSPGDAHYGSITVRSRVGRKSRGLYDWWNTAANGKGSGRKVTVTVLGCDNSLKRQYNFSQCIPTRYQPYALTDLPQVAVETIIAKCGRFEMAADSSGMAMAEWINATVQGQDQRRDVTIWEIIRDGAGGRTFEYLDAFPTRYVFPRLDINSTSNLYEAISIKPNRLELYR